MRFKNPAIVRSVAQSNDAAINGLNRRQPRTDQVRASALPLDQQHPYVALIRQRAWSIAANEPAAILGA